VGDWDHERNLLIERGTKLIRFCDLDAGTPGFAPPTQEDDMGELLRLARRLKRNDGAAINNRLLHQLSSARTIDEVRRALDAAKSNSTGRSSTAQPP
jgi:hypothetical protein